MVIELKLPTKNIENFIKNRQNQISMCTILQNKNTSRQKEASNLRIIKKTQPYLLN